MKDILIVEWISICEQFIQDYQSQHKRSEKMSLIWIWKGIVSTKYLNSTLIEKCIEILPKLNDESKTLIGSRMSSNSALTMDCYY